MSGKYICVYCLRNNFASSRALSQHLSKNEDCRAQMEARISALDGAQDGSDKFLEYATITRQRYEHDYYDSVKRVRKAPRIVDNRGVPLSLNNYREVVQQQRTAFEESDQDYDQPDFDSDDDDNMFDNIALDSENVIDTLNDNFKKHCEDVSVKFPSYLTKDQEEAIKLLAILRESNAPLCLYKRVMEWFFRSTNRLYSHQALGESNRYVSRDAAYDAMHKRYNIDKKKSFMRFIWAFLCMSATVSSSNLAQIRNYQRRLIVFASSTVKSLVVKATATCQKLSLRRAFAKVSCKQRSSSASCLFC